MGLGDELSDVDLDLLMQEEPMIDDPTKDSKGVREASEAAEAIAGGD